MFDQKTCPFYIKYTSSKLLIIAILVMLSSIFIHSSIYAAKEFKIVFTSDSETSKYSDDNAPWNRVLRMSAQEGVQLMLEQGDYFNNDSSLGRAPFDEWSRSISRNFKSSSGVIPVLGPPTEGYFSKTEFPLPGYFSSSINKLGSNTTSGGCLSSTSGECSIDSSIVNGKMVGGNAGNYWVKKDNIGIVFMNAQWGRRNPVIISDWIDKAFNQMGSVDFRICSWHNNHFDFNVFSKNAYDIRKADGQGAGPPEYELYKKCADWGALIFNGNVHQYARSCLLDNVGAHLDGGPNSHNTNRINRVPVNHSANNGQYPLQNHTTSAANCSMAGKPNSIAHGVEQIHGMGEGKTMVFTNWAGFALRDYVGAMSKGKSYCNPDADINEPANTCPLLSNSTNQQHCFNNTCSQINKNDYPEDRNLCFNTCRESSDPLKGQKPQVFIQDEFRHDYDGWWSTIIAGDRYCRGNCTNGDLSKQDRSKDMPIRSDTNDNGIGALIMTFNYQGDSKKIHGVYKTADKKLTLDEFVIHYDSNGVPTPTPTPSVTVTPTPSSTPTPVPTPSFDLNNDGLININDLVELINYVFGN